MTELQKSKIWITKWLMKLMCRHKIDDTCDKLWSQLGWKLRIWCGYYVTKKPTVEYKWHHPVVSYPSPYHCTLQVCCYDRPCRKYSSTWERNVLINDSIWMEKKVADEGRHYFPRIYDKRGLFEGFSLVELKRIKRHFLNHLSTSI